MKFIRDLLLSITKSILVLSTLGVLSLSLIQKKFPPSYEEAQDLFQGITTLVKLNTKYLDPTSKQNFITSRQDLLKDIEKADPTMASKLAEQLKNVPTLDVAPTAKDHGLPDMTKHDIALLTNRLEQSEYRMRVLEYEMKQLKDEYKKLKNIPAK